MTTSTRRGGAEHAAPVVAALLTAMALVGVLLIVLITSDKASAASGGGPLGSGATGGSSGRSGSNDQGGSGAAAGNTNGASGGQSSSAAGGTQPLGAAQLRALFPLPVGAHRVKPEFGGVPGERVYRVKARLPTIKAFYDRRLAKLGITWKPLTTTVEGTGQVTEWHGYLEGSRVARNVEAPFSIGEDDYAAPGMVTIDVTIHQY